MRKSSITTTYRLFILITLVSLLMPPMAFAKEPEAVDLPSMEIPRAPDDLPTISVWYGTNQSFGQLGNPQLMINILGNVSDPDGVRELRYSLNGNPSIELSMGPDNRRLDDLGDFNIDIKDEDLLDGVNSVWIQATDNLTNTRSVNVTVNYSRDNVWPLPFTTNWSAATSIQDQAQVIDGPWLKSGDTIRIDDKDYDRIVGLGDISWEDYEVTVPVTIHSVEEGKIYSGSPAVGAIIRWQGNTDDPSGPTFPDQPVSGYFPWGAIMWYRWFDNPPVDNDGRLQILGNNFVNIAEDLSGRTLDFDTTYIFKMRVESDEGTPPQYSFKVWEESSMEPVDWDLTGQGQVSDPENGFLALLAHHAVVSYGNVSIVPVGDPPPASNIVSDDFNVCSLNTGVWTFDDPVGDSSYALTGVFTDDALFEFTVPAGSNHNPHNNLAPRLVQSVNDTDFDVETKFETGLSLQYQMEGIIVEEDADSYLRFELFTDGSRTLSYTGIYEDGAQTFAVSKDLEDRGVSPLYMRVRRSGNRWTQWYSQDGSSWTSIVSFLHTMPVSTVGPYAANATGAGGTPAFTGEVDYFFNLDSPIVPEDGARNTLVINTVGDGSVTPTPDLMEYTCGQEVSLLAAPDAGWSLDEWSGDLSGSTNPITTTMSGPQVITATFTEENYDLTLNTVGQGSVAVDPDQPAYTYGEVVTLTATADPGWSFSAWTGDVTTTDNPEEVTIMGDTVVTATFTQNPYTLTVNTVGMGSISRDPDEPTYSYGEVVTVTATADPGWRFDSWSGAGTGSENPIPVTIMGNTVLTATFVQEVYTLTILTIGQGSVAVEPEQLTYTYGEVVTLTATADPDWFFINWTGDVSDNDNPIEITIVGNTTITANFALTPPEIKVYLPIILKNW